LLLLFAVPSFIFSPFHHSVRVHVDRRNLFLPTISPQRML
jgi:hypothetical protein